MIVSLLVVSLASTASLIASPYSDPFITPITLQEKKLLKVKQQLSTKESTKSLNLFKPKVPKPLESLKIQGILEADGSKLLVVSDPSTGESFILKEGDPVAPDTKLAKINWDSVELEKYYQKDGKVKRKILVLKVNGEE